MATSKAKKKFETTLHLPAGDAPVPDIGKALGQTGVNLVEVKRTYDAATAGQRGDVVPVVITVFEDRSFSMRYKTPPTSHLIRRELGGPGAGRPGHETAGVLSRDALRRVAERKLPDLNTPDVEVAMRIVAGTARSMGVAVES